MEKRRHDGPNTTSNDHSRKRAGQRDDPKPPPDLILPEPTFSAVDQNKKSHARKQPAGHIPRPRNAFILFRCDFVRQKKIPESVEKDHRNISRIIGKIWQQMSVEQKEPWKQMAEQEKINHHKIYPNYKFSVGLPTKKKSKRGESDNNEEAKMKTEEEHIILERASSCPPGAEVISQSSFESEAPRHGDPLRTRDDLSRRPSSTVYYRSTPYDLVSEMQRTGFFSNPVNQHYFVQALVNGDTSTVRRTEEGIDDCEMCEDTASGRFCGPRVFEHLELRYPIAGPISSAGPETPFMPLMSTEAYDPSLDTQDEDYSESLLATLPPLPRNFNPELLPSYRTQSDSDSSHGKDIVAMQIKSEEQQARF